MSLPEPSPQLVTSLAASLLALNPQPAPRFRLLRDVLRLPAGDPELAAARAALDDSPPVRLLAQTQLPDGTWGRFHTRDSAVKQVFPTSEIAIEHALALGLDAGSPVLQRAAGFIAGHITGAAQWSDPLEKHDNPLLWSYGTRLVSAANLALIDPAHPLLDEIHQHMQQVLAAAFQSGGFRIEDECAAHVRLSGIESKQHNFLRNKYGLVLLSARPLPAELEDALLDYMLNQYGSIYYVGPCGLRDLPPVIDRRFILWLQGQEVLARFPGWARHAARAVEWIWNQRGADGLWDLDQWAARTNYFPLSRNWRQRAARIIDCSARVLALLRATG